MDRRLAHVIGAVLEWSILTARVLTWAVIFLGIGIAIWSTFEFIGQALSRSLGGYGP